jgi:hypothetical protein
MINATSLACLSLFILFTHTAFAVLPPGPQTANKIQPTAAGKKCGSFGWNLQGCDCKGATGACSLDVRKCPQAPKGVKAVAYINAGRCDPKAAGDCDVPKDAIDTSKPASEGGWNEPWLKPMHPAVVKRNKVSCMKAAKGGYTSVEPDNSGEVEWTPDALKLLADSCEVFGLKIVIKNTEKGVWDKFLSVYPAYKRNISMGIAESCVRNKDCAKYKQFTDAGIPFVFVEYANYGGDAKKLDEEAKKYSASGMMVTKRERAVGLTRYGKEECYDGLQLKPNDKPFKEDEKKFFAKELEKNPALFEVGKVPDSAITNAVQGIGQKYQIDMESTITEPATQNPFAAPGQVSKPVQDGTLQKSLQPTLQSQLHI